MTITPTVLQCERCRATIPRLNFACPCGRWNDAVRCAPKRVRM